MDGILFGYIFLSLVGLVIYFLPFMIAEIRRTEHDIAIFWVNCLLGWTALGWIAALVWAVAEKKSAQSEPLRNHVGQARADWDLLDEPEKRDRISERVDEKDSWILK